MRRLSVNFHSFGDMSSASARLRSWKIAEELRLQGHDAVVNGPAVADVEVFQKVRPAERLGMVLRRPRTFTVYDIDDNYLLEDVGVRDDILAFVNGVDMVTVGSEQLFETLSSYHDNVHLFDNPLDVASEEVVREESGWRGRIGWVGNRTNLRALEELDLHFGVTTVTKGGDVEWSVDTVDAVVSGFDLVLVPVILSEWSGGKNANRLLKAVALGVPFLASRTPEHERAVRGLGMSDRLLVDAGRDWNEAIERIREDYVEIEREIRRARLAALRDQGIRPTTTKWLNAIRGSMAAEEQAEAHGSPKRLPPVGLAGASLASTDVVVLGENEPEWAIETLASLEREEVRFASLTVVSANRIEDPGDRRVLDEHADFFDVYDAFARQVTAGAGERVLMVRAGARLQKGFFGALREAGSTASVQLFREQWVDAAAPSEPPPLTLDQLMMRPFTPNALLVSRDLVEAAGGLRARSLSYALWDLLLSVFQRDDVTVSYESAPFILTDRRLGLRHAIQSYSVWLERHKPELLSELPGMNDEWQRLSYVLHDAIIERHRGAFERRLSGVAPALLDRVLELERLERTLRARIDADQRRIRELTSQTPTPAAASEPGKELEPVRPQRRPVHLPLRIGWRAARIMIPERLRARLYPIVRRPYLTLFPERTPRSAKGEQG